MIGHSYRVADSIATRSPGWTPSAIKPKAAERTWAATCAQVTSDQEPSTSLWMITWSGSSVSWENTELTTVSYSSTVNDAGTLNSRTILALSDGESALGRK